MRETIERCPECRDLFVAEDGKLPKHYLDTCDGAQKCEGSERLMSDV